MQKFNPRDISLLSVPSDVVKHHIMRFLSLADLLTLSMSCTTMQKIFQKWMLGRGETKASKAKFQSKLLNDIFRVGCYSQLVWFQENLEYLSMNKLNRKHHILVAAEGDQLYFLVSFVRILFY